MRSKFCPAGLLSVLGIFAVGPLSAQDNLTLSSPPATSELTASARLSVRLLPGFSVNSAARSGPYFVQVDYNQNGVSDFLESQAAATPTYFTSFETFSTGDINNQGGWFGGPVAPSVASGNAYEGSNAVSIGARDPTNSLVHYFNAIPGQTVTFVDFASRPHAGATPDSSSFFDLGACRIAFVNAGGNGQVQIFIGNGSGGGTWTSISGTYALGAQSQAAAWIRFTARIDYAAKKWDIYLNGRLVACELGFVANGFSYFSAFWIFGGTAGPTAFDYPYVAAINPLFKDNDLDGMDDDWETANGLNPANPADRTANLDGDGLINIEEFRLGTPANSASAPIPTFEIFTPL